MHDRTEELSSRQAITDVLHHYCRAIDRLDRALAYSVWHADGIADYGAYFNGSARAYVDLCFTDLAGLIAQSHHLSNIIIALDGDAASSESYIIGALRYSQGTALMQRTTHGRYADHWLRRDGRWAIAKRVYLHDFDDVQSITDGMERRGTSNREDLSYRLNPPLQS